MITKRSKKYKNFKMELWVNIIKIMVNPGDQRGVNAIHTANNIINEFEKKFVESTDNENDKSDN